MITVFSTQWFAKYNKQICWLARLPFIGEKIFCFKKFGHYVDRKSINAIFPNTVEEYLKLQWYKCVKVKGQWVAYDCTNKLHNRLIKKECKEKLLPTYKRQFFVRNEYALRLQKVFYPIWITFHIWDIITRPFPQLNLGFDTLNIYPISASDGVVELSNTSSTWSNVRDATTGNNYYDGYTGQTADNASVCATVGFPSFTGRYYIARAFYPFDTSSLTSGATITGATFGVYVTQKNDQDNDGYDYLNIYQTSQASSSGLSLEDYDQIGTTQGATSIDLGDISIGAVNTWTLNSTGIGWISKTGITYLGMREGHDAEDHPITYTYFNGIEANYSTNATSGKRPNLIVTYTIPVPPTITTQNATLITMLGATGNGNITNNGGLVITEKGICYKLGTSGDPTTADSTVHDHTDSTGAFTEIITGLLTGRAYRFRAYAINSAGTSYGDTVQVYTLTNFLQMFQ